MNRMIILDLILVQILVLILVLPEVPVKKQLQTQVQVAPLVVPVQVTLQIMAKHLIHPTRKIKLILTQKLPKMILLIIMLQKNQIILYTIVSPWWVLFYLVYFHWVSCIREVILVYNSFFILLTIFLSLIY
ncbi:MAG: hypothetical protein ACP5C3_09495 [Methanomicrobiales archaeon]